MRRLSRVGALFGSVVMCISLSFSSVYGEELQNQVEETQELPADDEDTESTGDQTELQTETGLETVGNDAAEVEKKSYDIVKPVIDKVVLPQEGQVLTAEDHFLAYIYAHDDDSGIDMISVSIYMSGASISTIARYSQDLGCYVVDEPLTNVNAPFVYIASLVVADKAGNCTDLNTRNEDTDEWIYQIPFQYEETEYVVQDLVLEEQGQTLTEKDTVTLSFTAEPAVKETEEAIYARFVTDDGGIHDLYMEYNDETGRYECSESASGFWEGTWMLSSIGFGRRGDLSKFSLEEPEKYWFTVEIAQKAEDTEPPVITSIEMEKNGQSIQAGESVTIRVGLKDNVGINEFPMLYIDADQKDILSSSFGVILQYDPESGMYVGEFETDEDTYPCEWYISDAKIYDLAGNCASLTDYRSDFHTYHPYYVNVINQDTFVSEPYTGSVTFVYLNDRGSWSTASEVTKDNLKKRSTFQEAGIEIPETIYDTSGIEQTGWVDEYGNIVDENTQVPSRDQAHMTVYATYAQTPVTFDFVYYTVDGERGHIRDTYGMPNGSTYGDIKEYLASVPLPDDASTEFGFIGWNLGGIDEDAEVEAYDSIYTEAVYKENIYRLIFSYLNADGQWVSKNLLYSYEDGTTYGEVFEYAQKYLPKDCAADLELKGFVLEDDMAYDPNERIPTDHSVNDAIRFHADYGERAAVLLSFGYYDRVGNYAEDQKIVIVDKGSTYAQILSEYTPETPDFYPGLVFTGWSINEEGTVEESGQRLYFEAQYENCLLRFIIDERFAEGIPEDDDFEYMFCMVAERGETIALPTEFEGYGASTWLYGMWPEDGMWTVDGDVTFLGFGEKIPVPEEPETTPDSENPSEDPVPNTPAVPPMSETPAEEVNKAETDLSGSLLTEAADTGNEVPLRSYMAGFVISAAALCVLAAAKKCRSDGRCSHRTDGEGRGY